MDWDNYGYLLLSWPCCEFTWKLDHNFPSLEGKFRDEQAKDLNKVAIL